MAAGLSFAGEIVIDQLLETGWAEAGEMASVDDCWVQHLQGVKGLEISWDVGVIGIVDEGAVVDDIARQKDTGGFFVEADATGGMAGCVDDVESSIAKVDNVAVFQGAIDLGGFDLISVRVPAFWLRIKHFVGGVAVSADQFITWVLENLGFSVVNAAAGKLMVAADVIKVCVAGNGDDWAFGHQGHMLAEGEMTEAAVEEEIMISATDMPHVAAEKGFDPGFMDQGNIVAEADGFVPFSGADAMLHVSFPE
jgi:hypothetical protein